MYQISKILTVVSILVISIVFVLLSSVNIDTLMNGTQSGKSFVFFWGIEIISTLSIIRFWLNPGLKKINLSIIDLLLFTFVLYILIQNNGAELVHSLLFLELTGLAILYFIIRQQNHQSYLWLLMALIAGGLIQSIYGNLQLWGYYPSHHGLFKITGSFFNPGPYSGYLASVFPTALGFYFFSLKVRLFEGLNRKTTNSLNNLVGSLIRKVSVVSMVRKVSVVLGGLTGRNRSNAKHSNSSNSKASNSSNSETFTRIIAIATIIAILLVLPASRSRAAWLAVLVSLSYLFFIKHQLYSRIRLYFNTRIRQFGLISFLAILLSTTVLGLYYFKKGSADGRLLIWKVSAEMIKDKPVFGHGYDGFKNDYMDYQAVYFEQNPDSEEALVAGDTNYAFNELIQLTVENGIIGILPLFAIIFFLLFGKVKTLRSDESEEKPVISNDRLSLLSSLASVEQRDSERYLIHISHAVILSILVFGLFSYPLQILPVKICLVVALAIAIGNSDHKEKVNSHEAIHISNPIRFVLKSILFVGCLGFLWLATEHLNQLKTAYSSWENAFDLYNIGIYDECLAGYEEAYPMLKTNGDFLTNYGKALSMAEKHYNAVAILLQAAKYYPNTVVYTALGDCYKKLSQTSNAEQAYLHAWYMNPSRFYPKYLLAKLYYETGQNAKAIEVAKELLEKDIKIESTAIQEIREEMKRIIEKSNAETRDESKIHTNKNLNPIYKVTKEGTYRSVVPTDKFMLQKW